MMANLIRIYVLLMIGIIFNTNALTNFKVPKFENLKIDSFFGLVKENERIVVISPRIKVTDAELCGFELFSSQNDFNRNQINNEIPFNVRIVDRIHGEALIEAKKNLNCEQRRSYKFKMRAFACNGLRSNNATVHITVEDVNEFEPVFKQTTYSASINEGKLYKSILRLQATDQDCSAKYSEIYKFEIIGGDNPVSPFTIDSIGNLINTKPLFASETSNYILEVVAYDGGMKRSKPALINIKINKICKQGWQSSSLIKTNQRIEYIPNSGNRILFPDAELQICEPCKVDNISIQVSLDAGHIGKGCDRDTYSVELQRKLCNARHEGIDLLPSTQLEWTRSLLQDQGHDSDAIFLFKGEQHAQYPAAQKPILSQNLSVSFWMQHSPLSDYKHNKHIKEHILCLADDHKKNRHHFAVFVRNCRLILLFRRKYLPDPHIIFRPAEWRWKLNQVCDNHWHHYVINIKFPDIELYIDGIRYRNNSKSPEIVDDWPLHNLLNVNTSLVVGACLAGSDGSFKHHFNGYLAGLNLINNAIEQPEVIKCMVQCKETIGLVTDLNELDTLNIKDPDFKVNNLTHSSNLNKNTKKKTISISQSLINKIDERLNIKFKKLIKQINDQTTGIQVNILQNQDGQQLLIKSQSIIQTEDILSQIFYRNDREFPTPGHRNLHIKTNLACKNKILKIPLVETYLMVLPSKQLTITINGTNNLAREYGAFIQGISLFSTVNFLINHEKMDTSINSNINVLNNKNKFYQSNKLNLSKTISKELDSDENLIENDQNNDDLNNFEDTNEEDFHTEEDLMNKETNQHQKFFNTPKLDTCTIQVYPPLNPDHEYFRLPINYMNYLNVNYKKTQDGLIIYGIDTVHAYEQILHEIIFFNRKPAYYLNRVFKLTCSELNGRFLSNDYIQTLTVIHPKVTSTLNSKEQDRINLSKLIKSNSTLHSIKLKLNYDSDVKKINLQMKNEGKLLAANQLKKMFSNQLKTKPHKINTKNYLYKLNLPIQSNNQIHQYKIKFKDSELIKTSNLIDSSLMEKSFAKIPASHAITVIIIVCVLFLVFMIALGVVRIRAAQNRTKTRDEQEMIWDDSSLNITVNPLDKMNQILNQGDNKNINDDDDDTGSIDDNSLYSNVESSDDEEHEVKTIHQTRRELEWDDSTMNF